VIDISRSTIRMDFNPGEVFRVSELEQTLSRRAGIQRLSAFNVHSSYGDFSTLSPQLS
jgi:hypothetical protein